MVPAACPGIDGLGPTFPAESMLPLSHVGGKKIFNGSRYFSIKFPLTIYSVGQGTAREGLSFS